MIPKPLHHAAHIVRTLAECGCQIRAEENALIIHEPNTKFTDELRNQVQKHKLSILALLMREALLHLVQVLDMSKPEISVGVQEEYAAALLAAMCLVGDPWAEDDKNIDLWKDEVV
jgi:hypothetical protein